MPKDLYQNTEKNEKKDSSERFYGAGYKWTAIVRSEDAPKKPDGFAYYFLDGDVAYVSWEEENQIHSLPVTNPVEQNPFHEPEKWEAGNLH